MDSDTKKDNFKKNIISETLLLLIITASSYWLSFIYESSYLKVFQIPTQLIDVSTSLLLTTMFSLSGAIFLLILLWNVILMFMPSRPATKSKFIRIALIISFMFWWSLAYGFREKDVWLYVIALGFVTFFEFIWPFLIFKAKKGLNGKVITDEHSEEKIKSKDILDRIYDNFGPLLYFMVFFFFVANYLVIIYGTASAEKQEIFPVDITDNSVAVVRMYKDKFICIRYNLNNKRVETYFIREATTNEYANKKIGPLNLIK